MLQAKTMTIFKIVKKKDILLHLCRTFPKKVNNISWQSNFRVMAKYRQAAREAKLFIVMKNSEEPSKNDRKIKTLIYIRLYGKQE